MKQTIGADIMSQRMVNTAIVAVVKVNNHDGSKQSACAYLTDIMSNDSSDLGDKVYGDIWWSTVQVTPDYEWTSKTLAYSVKVSETPEETTLELIRKQYTYDF